MKKHLLLIGNALLLILLSACSKRESIIPLQNQVITPPSSCSIPLSGTITRNSTGDVSVNTDVVFTVTAGGCSGRYLLYANGQSVISFSGSSTVYTQRYTIAQTARQESVTIVDAADTSKSIVISSAGFNVVSSGSTGGNGTCSMTVSPSLLNVNLDSNGSIALPLPQIQVQVRENSGASIILAGLQDDVSGRASVQWVTADLSASTLQQIQISPSVAGNHVLTAQYRTTAGGPIAGNCQAIFQLNGIQNNPGSGTCIVTAQPSEVDVGQNLTFTLSSSAQAREAWIDGFQVPVGGAQVTVRASNPGDWYVNGRVIDSSGITRNCYAPYTVRAPRITGFTMNGQSIDSLSVRSPQQVLVQWTSQNADSCTVNPGNYSGLNGQITLANLPPNQTSFYTLVCTRGANQVSKTFSINVQAPVPVYENTPSARCNPGVFPTFTNAPIVFPACEVVYRDNCNGANPAINGNIAAELALGTCQQISCTRTLTGNRYYYGRYRCQGKSVLIRYE